MATTANGVKLRIKSVSERLDGTEGMVIITDASEYNQKGVWLLGEDAATRFLKVIGIPHADIDLGNAVRKLNSLVSLPSKSTLVFDAIYGKEGEEYTDSKGTKRTYKKTGYNCLNLKGELSTVATADLNALADKISLAISAKKTELKFSGVNAHSMTPTPAAAEVEEDENVQVG